MAIQENRSKLADSRYRVYGPKPNKETRAVIIKPKIILDEQTGEANFAIQGSDPEGKSGTIKLEYLEFKNFLRKVAEVAENPSQWIDRKATFRKMGYNPTTRKGDLELFLFVGRDKDGIVYIGMKVPGQLSSAIKAEFRPRFGLVEINEDGKILETAESSSNIAWTWANVVERVGSAEYDRTWSFRGQDYYQQRKNNRGNGNNNGGGGYRSNNGGGYNNGGGNNGGYNSQGYQQQQPQQQNNNNNGWSESNDNFDDVGF